MPSMPTTFRRPGAPTRRELERDTDARRGSARARGYDGAWAKASRSRLTRHPLCEYCEVGAFGQQAKPVAATLTDHLHPHRGDRAVFWCSELWVSSCAPCHNGPKQALERQGEAALDDLARRLGRPTLTEALA